MGLDFHAKAIFYDSIFDAVILAWHYEGCDVVKSYIFRGKYCQVRMVGYVCWGSEGITKLWANAIKVSCLAPKQFSNPTQTQMSTFVNFPRGFTRDVSFRIIIYGIDFVSQFLAWVEPYLPVNVVR